MNATIISFAVGALVLGYLQPDLVPLMLTSVATFTALYFLLFLCVLVLYPTGGAIWIVAYEYVFGYHLEAAGRI